MKKEILSFLALLLTVTACAGTPQTEEKPAETPVVRTEEEKLTELGSPQEQTLEEQVYQNLVEEIDNEKYFIETVQVREVSQEYVDDLKANAKSNIYFGHSLAEVADSFDGNKFVFTADEEGHTTVEEFQEYTDPYEGAILDTAIGGGLLLACVTVSAVTAPGAVAASPAISVILAASAKTGLTAGASGAAIAGLTTWLVEGAKTGDFPAAGPEALKSAANGFKLGAITGVITGGAAKTLDLKHAAKNLTMNEAALIQKESKYSSDLIRTLSSMDEYKIYKDSGLKEVTLGGRKVLMSSDINMSLQDKNGLANLERCRLGKPPVDADGISIELHHVGQANDGPLAMLTKSQHTGSGNNCVLHPMACSADKASEINRPEFEKIKSEIWKALAEMYTK